jgi:hypothetical protein
MSRRDERERELGPLGQKVATVLYVAFGGLGGIFCLGLGVRLTIWPVEGVPVILLYAVGMVFIGTAIAVPLTKTKWRHKPRRKGQFDDDPVDGV